MLKLRSNISTVKLIGHCLAANELNHVALSKLRKKLSSRHFNWEILCHTAGANWLLPYMHYILEQQDFLGLVPEQVLTEIHAVRHLSESRNQRITNQLETIITVLNQEKIQPLLLKGASYLMRPVSELQQFRMISDIDLLVNESLINTAVDALKRQGYSFSNYLPDGTNYHLDPMVKVGMPARLELHINPLAAECNQLISVENTWNNADLIDKNGLSYYIFKPKYRLIHQFAHAQLHSRDFANDRVDLRQLFDFYLMCQIYSKTINWTFAEEFTSAHHSKIWIDYILMAKLVFSDFDNPAVSSTIEQRTHARKTLAKLSGDNHYVCFYHWLERLTRLPQRLTSSSWYASKYRYLLDK